MKLLNTPPRMRRGKRLIASWRMRDNRNRLKTFSQTKPIKKLRKNTSIIPLITLRQKGLIMRHKKLPSTHKKSQELSISTNRTITMSILTRSNMDNINKLSLNNSKNPSTNHQWNLIKFLFCKIQLIRCRPTLFFWPKATQSLNNKPGKD